MRGIWVEQGRYGLHKESMGCLWKIWTCERSVGCMGVEGWPYGLHGGIVMVVGCM